MSEFGAVRDDNARSAGPLDAWPAVTSHVKITRRKRAEMELAFRPAYDPLTGLPRTLSGERLSGAIGQADQARSAAEKARQVAGGIGPGR